MSDYLWLYHLMDQGETVSIGNASLSIAPQSVGMEVTIYVARGTLSFAGKEIVVHMGSTFKGLSKFGLSLHLE